MRNYGHDAVIIFFVLSGYVIAYVSDRRHGNFRSYFSARLSRLLSVMLPVMLLTILLDATGSRLDSYVYGTVPTDRPVQRIASNLFFLSQSFGHNLKFFSNGPMWSLSYEFWYYAIFGLWVYLPKGKARFFGVAAAACIAGTKILLLFPIWLLGVAAYHLHQQKNLRFHGSVTILAWSCIAILLLALNQVPGLLSIQQSLSLNDGLGFSKYLYTDYLTGLAVFAGVVMLNPRSSKLVSDNLKANIRKIAGATFPLYLLHVPLILFIASITPQLSSHPLLATISAFVTIYVCYRITPLTEAINRIFRGWFTGFSAGLMEPPELQPQPPNHGP
tara:strand:+ start:1798 stop:2790 length:993 start_codon:yes stop_codon:yes gene_type:complete